MGFGLVIGFIDHFQVVTTNNYTTVTDFPHFKALHANLISLFPLIFTIRFLATDLQHRNYKSLTKSHDPNITALQHI
jgi:hypothetical protein